MNTASKIPVPSHIAAKMDAWREGCFLPFPKEYSEFHENLAKVALEKLKLSGLKIHRTFGDSDGWGDGFKTTWAIIEEPSGRLVKLSWHDGNQEFFEHGSGSWPYRFTASNTSK